MIDMDIVSSEHLRGRQPTYDDHLKLQEALRRYGYHAWVQARNDLDVGLCNYFKPYYSFTDNNSLVIVHSYCNIQEHEHAQDFLQRMIPIMGKLDTLAYYESGEKYKLVPRLRIYL